MNAQAVALTLCLALASAACASSGPNPFSEDRGVTSGTVLVEVENNHFNDATVYAITSAGEQRLGIVQGKGQRSFRARLMGPDQMRLRVRLLAGGGFTTEAMPAAPGEILVLIIPAAFDLKASGSG